MNKVKLLNSNEVCEILNIHTSTLALYRKQGKIGFMKFNARTMRYFPSDVMRYLLNEHHISQNTELKVKHYLQKQNSNLAYVVLTKYSSPTLTPKRIKYILNQWDYGT